MARWKPVAVDLLLTVTAAVVITLAISVATEPGSRPPDALAYGLGVLMAAPLLVRRHWPLGVLLATVAVLLTYYALRYPGVSPALPLAGALYTASAAGRLRWVLAIIVFFVAADVLVPLIHGFQPVLVLLIGVVERALGMIALALLGETVRSRRQRLAAQAAAAEQRLTQERLRIARDIHDILAHTISAITVQAGLASDAMGGRPAEARTALKEIRSASKDATAELKAALNVLRTDEPDHGPPGLGNLEPLLLSARTAGLAVEVTRAGGPLPPVVDASAYRIVQEALTNVVRHARATRVGVSLTSRDGELVIDVTDDGEAAAQGPPGHGIIGMTERAAMLGGVLTARAGPGGGFRVHAVLPISAERR